MSSPSFKSLVLLFTVLPLARANIVSQIANAIDGLFDEATNEAQQRFNWSLAATTTEGPATEALLTSVDVPLQQPTTSLTSPLIPFPLISLPTSPITATVAPGTSSLSAVETFLTSSPITEEIPSTTSSESEPTFAIPLVTLTSSSEGVTSVYTVAPSIGTVAVPQNTFPIATRTVTVPGDRTITVNPETVTVGGVETDTLQTASQPATTYVTLQTQSFGAPSSIITQQVDTVVVSSLTSTAGEDETDTLKTASEPASEPASTSELVQPDTLGVTTTRLMDTVIIAPTTTSSTGAEGVDAASATTVSVLASGTISPPFSVVESTVYIPTAEVPSPTTTTAENTIETPVTTAAETAVTIATTPTNTMASPTVDNTEPTSLGPAVSSHLVTTEPVTTPVAPSLVTSVEAASVSVLYSTGLQATGPATTQQTPLPMTSLELSSAPEPTVVPIISETTSGSEQPSSLSAVLTVSGTQDNTVTPVAEPTTSTEAASSSASLEGAPTSASPEASPSSASLEVATLTASTAVAPSTVTSVQQVPPTTQTSPNPGTTATQTQPVETVLTSALGPESPTTSSSTSQNTNWLPDGLITATASPTSKPIATQTGQDESSASTSTTANLPQVIAPAVAPTNTAGMVEMQLGFKYPLNYPFVASNPLAAAQIAEYLPEGVAYGLGLDSSKVQLRYLVPYAMTDYDATVVRFYLPKKNVDGFVSGIGDPSSMMFSNPNPTIATLMSLIDTSIPTTPEDSTNTNDGSSGGSSGSGDSSSSGPTNGWVGSLDQSMQPSMKSSRASGKTAGISVGTVGGAVAIGSVVAIVLARKRRKRRAQLSDTDSEVSVASDDASTYSYDPFDSYRLSHASSISDIMPAPARGPLPISQPVMSENSLGWL